MKIGFRTNSLLNTHNMRNALTGKRSREVVYVSRSLGFSDRQTQAKSMKANLFSSIRLDFLRFEFDADDSGGRHRFFVYCDKPAAYMDAP